MVIPTTIGLVGLALCWQWRMKGLVTAGAFFLFYLIFACLITPSHEQFWYVSTTLSIMMSLIVTTLCLEEIEFLSQSVQVESKSRLETLIRLDENRKETEKAWKTDRIELVKQLQETQQQVKDREHRISVYQKQLSLAGQEVDEIKETKQKLLRRLDKVQVTLQSFQENSLKKEDDTPKNNPITLYQELSKKRLNLLNQLRGEHFQLQLNFESKPKNYWALIERLKEAEGRYKQLRAQFGEKQSALEAVRKELFEANETVEIMKHLNQENDLQEPPALNTTELQNALEQEIEEKHQLLKELKEIEAVTSSLMTEIASEQAHCLF